MKHDPHAEPMARTLYKRGRARQGHFLAPKKAQGRIENESSLEVTFAHALDLHPKVKSFRPQPCCVDLGTGRVAPTRSELIALVREAGFEPQPYTPDFAVTLIDGRSVLREVRARYWIEADREAFTAVRDAMARFGHAHAFVTDATLTDPVARNASLLSRYGVEALTGLEEIRAFCAAPRPFHVVLKALALPQSALLAAIAHGHLACDLRCDRLRPTTELWASGGDTRHLELVDL